MIINSIGHALKSYQVYHVAVDVIILPFMLYHNRVLVVARWRFFVPLSVGGSGYGYESYPDCPLEFSGIGNIHVSHEKKISVSIYIPGTYVSTVPARYQRADEYIHWHRWGGLDNLRMPSA